MFRCPGKKKNTNVSATVQPQLNEAKDVLEEADILLTNRTCNRSVPKSDN